MQLYIHFNIFKILIHGGNILYVTYCVLHMYSPPGVVKTTGTEMDLIQ